MNNQIIQLFENIFDSKLDRHYRELLYDETLIYIQHIRSLNKRRFRSNYLRALFDALYRGVESKKVFFAECTANETIARLQYMTGNALLPLSGIKAIAPIIYWIYNQIRTNTALEALSIAGVYFSQKQRLFVFIPNTKSEFWDNENVFYILTHELCHLYANIYNMDFKTLFYNDYIYPFYQNFIKNIITSFRISNIDQTQIDQIAKIYADHLMEFEDYEKKSNKILNKMFKEIDQINKQITDILFSLLSGIFEEDYADIQIEDYLQEIIYKTYHDIGINIPKKFKFYQEILFCSEIVCIAAFVHNKRPAFITMLNNVFK